MTRSLSTTSSTFRLNRTTLSCLCRTEAPQWQDEDDPNWKDPELCAPVGQRLFKSRDCRPERLKNLEPKKFDRSGAFVPLQLAPVDDEFDANGKLVGRKMSKEEYYRLCREQDAEGDDEEDDDESSSPEPAAAATAKTQSKKAQPKKEAAQKSTSNSRAKACADLWSLTLLSCTGKRARGAAAETARGDRDGDSKIAAHAEEADSSGKPFAQRALEAEHVLFRRKIEQAAQNSCRQERCCCKRQC